MSDEIAAAALGALLGALSAFAIGYAAERQRDFAHDRAAARNLILDLATRRAFAIAEFATRTSEPDADRLVQAVLALRNDIRSTRQAFRGDRPKAVSSLVQMSIACNHYLEAVQWSPVGAQDLKPLHAFKAEITDSARDLHAASKLREQFAAPGSLAFRP